MGTTTQIVVLPEKDLPLEVQELKLPDPTAHQVEIRQFASGICHSQLHVMQRPRSGPTILGHESTGVVTRVGSAVSDIKEGDRVMVSWVPRRAAEGRVWEIPDIRLSDGSKPASQGVFTWSDHTIADEAYVTSLPEWAPTDVTAIIGCAVMTGAGAVINTAGVRPGNSVAIFGVGGVGLSAVAAAAAVSADPIIAVDLDASKLEFARAFGATHLIDASETDAVQAIRALTWRPGDIDAPPKHGGGTDFAFDCIGVPATMSQILEAVRWSRYGDEDGGGVAVLVGVPMTTIEPDTRAIESGEKVYRGSRGGSCRPERDFPMFLRWFQEGKLDLERLVTRRFRLEEINEATEALEHGHILGRAIIEFDH